MLQYITYGLSPQSYHVLQLPICIDGCTVSTTHSYDPIRLPTNITYTNYLQLFWWCISTDTINLWRRHQPAADHIILIHYPSMFVVYFRRFAASIRLYVVNISQFMPLLLWWTNNPIRGTFKALYIQFFPSCVFMDPLRCYSTLFTGWLLLATAVGLLAGRHGVSVLYKSCVWNEVK